MDDADRRHLPRFQLTVIHRHRVAEHTLRRVSELVYVDGQPKAVLEWIDIAGMRTPLYVSELDPRRLRRGKPRNTFYYDGETIDPREPLLGPARTAG
jgi:hypothetical protein